jgi:hypothetical protein
VRLTGSNWSSLGGRVAVLSWLTVRLVRRAHLAFAGIATRLEELKYLFRPGTGTRARSQRQSESLNSVGLPRRLKASVAPKRLGSREVHLKTGVAQWWG